MLITAHQGTLNQVPQAAQAPETEHTSQLAASQQLHPSARHFAPYIIISSKPSLRWKLSGKTQVATNYQYYQYSVPGRVVANYQNADRRTRILLYFFSPEELQYITNTFNSDDNRRKSHSQPQDFLNFFVIAVCYYFFTLISFLISLINKLYISFCSILIPFDSNVTTNNLK